MITMGLDLSLTGTGLVIVRDGTTVIVAERIRTTPAELLETRIGQIAARILHEFRKHRPDLTAVEDTAYRAPFSDSRVHELNGVVKFLLWNEDIPWIPVGTGTLKLFATGHGRADKPQMLEAARTYFPCPNHDIADAFFLAKYAHERYTDLVEA